MSTSPVAPDNSAFGQLQALNHSFNEILEKEKKKNPQVTEEKMLSKIFLQVMGTDTNSKIIFEKKYAKWSSKRYSQIRGEGRNTEQFQIEKHTKQILELFKEAYREVYRKPESPEKRQQLQVLAEIKRKVAIIVDNVKSKCDEEYNSKTKSVFKKLRESRINFLRDRKIALGSFLARFRSVGEVPTNGFKKRTFTQVISKKEYPQHLPVKEALSNKAQPVEMEVDHIGTGLSNKSVSQITFPTSPKTSTTIPPVETTKQTTPSTGPKLELPTAKTTSEQAKIETKPTKVVSTAASPEPLEAMEVDKKPETTKAQSKDAMAMHVDEHLTELVVDKKPVATVEDAMLVEEQPTEEEGEVESLTNMLIRLAIKADDVAGQAISTTAGRAAQAASAGTSLVAHTIGHQSTVALAAGTVYLTASSISLALSVIRMSADLVLRNKLYEPALAGAKESVAASVEDYRVWRDSRGDQAQGVLGVAGMIPIVNIFTSAMSQAEAFLRKGELANMNVFAKTAYIAFSALGAAAPFILSSIGKTAAQLGDLADWTSETAYKYFTNPELIQNALISSADRWDSTAWELFNMFEPKEGVKIEIVDADVEKFLEMSAEKQEDMLFAILNRVPGKDEKDKLKLTEDDKIRCVKALYDARQGNMPSTENIKMIIKAYAEIPKEERFIITPRLINKLDELTKLHYLNCIRKHAKLTPDENRFLFSKEMRNLTTATDFKDLDPDTQAKIEYFIARKFNLLLPEHQAEAYSYSVEQYNNLSEPNKQILLQQIKEHIDSSNNEKDKERIIVIISTHNAGKQITKEDKEKVLEFFTKYFENSEKTFLHRTLDERPHSLLSPDQIQKLIDEQSKKLESVEDPKIRADIDRVISSLKEQKEFVVKSSEAYQADATQKVFVSTPKATMPLELKPDKPKAVDFAKIHELIGPQITSGGWSNTLNWIGATPNAAIQASGMAVRELMIGSHSFVEPYITPEITNAMIRMPLLGQVFEKFLTKDKGYNFDLIKGGLYATSAVVKVVAVAPSLTNAAITTFLKDYYNIDVAAADKFLRTMPPAVLAKLFSAASSAAQSAEAVTQSITDSATTVRDLTENVKIANGLKAAKLSAEQATNAVEGITGKLANAISEQCPADFGNNLAVCNQAVKDVLSDPEKLKALTEQAGFQQGSSEFLKMTEDMIRTGKMPQITAALPELPAELPAINISPDLEAVTRITPLQESFISGITKPEFNFQETIPSSLGQAKRLAFEQGFTLPTVEQPSLSPESAGYVSGFVGTTAQAAKDTAQSAGSAISSLISYLTGSAAQAAGTTTNPIFEGILKELAGSVENLKLTTDQVNVCEKAARAVMEFDSFPYSLVKMVATNPTLAEWVVSGERASRIAGTIMSMLSGIAEAARLNADIAATQFEAREVVEKALTSTLDTMAGAAGKIVSEETMSAIKGAGYGAVGSIMGFAGTASALTLMATGGTGIIVPLALKVAPTLLSEAANQDISAKLHDALYKIGDATAKSAKVVGEATQAMIAAPGSYLESKYNLYKGKVDSLRIKNFQNKLDFTQQKVLVEHVINSSKIPEADRVRLKELLIKLDNRKLEGEEFTEIAMLTLKNYDLIISDDLSSKIIGATYFKHLDERTQNRIIDIVKKYDELSAAEINDPDIIVTKFNNLDLEKRKEIEYLSIQEYRNLSPEEQEDIYFKIVNYRDKGKDVKGIHEQSLKFKNISNEEIEKLLPLYNEVADETQTVFTPSIMKRMSDEKIKHCLLIIKEFGSSSIKKLGLDQLVNCLGSVADQPKVILQKEKLLSALAVALNQLKDFERDKYLNLTPDELNAFDDESKRMLVGFLSSKIKDKVRKRSDIRQLDDELTKIGTGKPLYSEYLSSMFNRLSVAEKKEFRASLDTKVLTEEMMNSLASDLKTKEGQFREVSQLLTKMTKVNIPGILSEVSKYKTKLKEAKNEKEAKEYQDKIKGMQSKLKIHNDEFRLYEDIKNKLALQISAINESLGNKVNTAVEIEKELAAVETAELLVRYRDMARGLVKTTKDTKIEDGIIKEYREHPKNWENAKRIAINEANGWVIRAQAQLKDLHDMIAEKESFKSDEDLDVTLKNKVDIYNLKTHFIPFYEIGLEEYKKAKEEVLKAVAKIDAEIK